MKATKARLLLCSLGALLLLGLLFVASPNIPANLDFSQVYITDRALLHGNTIYGPLEKIGDLPESVRRERQPLANPPWHYTLLLPLGLLPPEVAARVWAWIALLMVIATTYLLAPRNSPRT